MPDNSRIAVGVWSELGEGARWANEGVSRVIGFVIEGAATSGRYLFHVVVQPGLAETVRQDLRTLHAVEGRDWLVSEPDVAICATYMSNPEIATLPERERRLAAAALYCNDYVPVAGWFAVSHGFAASGLAWRGIMHSALRWACLGQACFLPIYP